MDAVTQTGSDTSGLTTVGQSLHTESALLCNASAIIELYHTEGASFDTHHTPTARLDEEQAPDHHRPVLYTRGDTVVVHGQRGDSSGARTLTSSTSRYELSCLNTPASVKPHLPLRRHQTARLPETQCPGHNPSQAIA